MHIQTFQERARALEDAFFYQVDQRLLAKLHEEFVAQKNRDALQAASGIADAELLDELVRIGVRPETLSAVSLIPLVMVAWADGKIDADEIRTIAKAEKDAGIAPDSMTHQMLEHWLTHKPDEKLLNTWVLYINTLRDSLSESGNLLLSKQVLKRAQLVAKSSGGAIDIEKLNINYGSVSPSEQQVLDRIRHTMLD